MTSLAIICRAGNLCSAKLTAISWTKWKSDGNRRFSNCHGDVYTVFVLRNPAAAHHSAHHLARFPLYKNRVSVSKLCIVHIEHSLKRTWIDPTVSNCLYNHRSFCSDVDPPLVQTVSDTPCAHRCLISQPAFHIWTAVVSASQALFITETQQNILQPCWSSLLLSFSGAFPSKVVTSNLLHSTEFLHLSPLTSLYIQTSSVCPEATLFFSWSLSTAPVPLFCLRVMLMQNILTKFTGSGSWIVPP